jgi:hypothetical protein
MPTTAALDEEKEKLLKSNETHIQLEFFFNE